MRAVNLIPLESRRGSGGPGKSGGAVYGLLGVLGLLVVLACAFAVSNKSVKYRETELAVAQRDVAAAEAKAGALAPYTQFAALRANRVQTVRSLAASRFDWAHALREVSRTIPANAWLTSLSGTIAPGAGGAAGTGAGGLRAALPVPAFEVVGCTTSHRSVSRVIARLRQIDGVQRVSLATSEKADSVSGGDGGGGGGASSSGDCRNGSDRFPKFELVVFFKPVEVAPATPAATPGAPAATTTSTTTSSTTTATPASTPSSTPGSSK